MGNLKPGATYVYERVKGVTYARELGADPSTRIVVGWDYDPNKPNDGSAMYSESQEAVLWRKIREAGKINPTLQESLERVKMLYYLSKENGT